MSVSPAPQLDYAPAAPAKVYRRWIRWLIRWGGLAALVAAICIHGPPMARQIWYLRGQRHCMNFFLPSGQVVYSNDSSDATLLLASGYKPVASVVGRTLNFIGPGTPSAQNTPTMSAGFSFPPLAEVGEDTIGSYAQVSNMNYQRLVVNNAPIRTGGFLHVRRNSQVGQDRLVAIVFLERVDPPAFPMQNRERRLEINALVWRPATWEPGSRLQLTGLTTLVMPGLDRHVIRVFAGQVDAANADRFTMSYSIDGKTGVIDAALDFFDRVRMQVRDGPATNATMLVR